MEDSAEIRTTLGEQDVERARLQLRKRRMKEVWNKKRKRIEEKSSRLAAHTNASVAARDAFTSNLGRGCGEYWSARTAYAENECPPLPADGHVSLASDSHSQLLVMMLPPLTMDQNPAEKEDSSVETPHSNHSALGRNHVSDTDNRILLDDQDTPVSHHASLEELVGTRDP